MCNGILETRHLPNRNFELNPVRGVDFRIGLGVAWNKEDPTTARDDIIHIARRWRSRRGEGEGYPDVD